MSAKPDRCPHCGSTNLAESPAPPPHHARLDCGDCGKWLSWIGAPMTAERAAAFTLPFGKYRGSSLASIAGTAEGVRYLEWLLTREIKPTIRRAVEFHLGVVRGRRAEPCS